MERKAAVAAALLLAGCATPQYESRLVAIASRPAATQQQAVAICEGQARLAAINAEQAAQASVDARNNQVTGIRCSTTNYGYSSDTDCRTTKPRGSATLGFVQGMTIGQAGANARDATLVSCLGQYGWRVQQYCVANCN